MRLSHWDVEEENGGCGGCCCEEGMRNGTTDNQRFE